MLPEKCVPTWVNPSLSCRKELFIIIHACGYHAFVVCNTPSLYLICKALLWSYWCPSAAIILLRPHIDISSHEQNHLVYLTSRRSMLSPWAPKLHKSQWKSSRNSGSAFWRLVLPIQSQNKNKKQNNIRHVEPKSHKWSCFTAMFPKTWRDGSRSKRWLKGLGN